MRLAVAQLLILVRHDLAMLFHANAWLIESTEVT